MLNQFNKLSDDISATGQIFPEQIDFIKESGFKSIICNRPDMEKPGQPHHANIDKLATENGIEHAYIPLQPGRLTPEILDAMTKALETMPKPILAHCASGMRSTLLWGIVNVKALGVDTVITTARGAGYDLAKFRPVLKNFAK
ncbi:MAG: TIGR01244 family sulfur transferase [Robiginitomaculum sp.]